MRDRRVKPGDGPSTESQTGSGAGRWVAAIVAICLLWLVAMVVTSYYGLEYKTPIRIENWKPRPNSPG